MDWIVNDDLSLIYETQECINSVKLVLMLVSLLEELPTSLEESTEKNCTVFVNYEAKREWIQHRHLKGLNF